MAMDAMVWSTTVITLATLFFGYLQSERRK